MMEIEKRLANSDLSQFKTAPVEHFVKEVLKYRNWKTGEALKRINYAPLKEISAEFYFNNIIRYLTGGKNTLSSVYKDLVDRYKDVIQPLKPETGCMRIAYIERPRSRKSKPIVSSIENKPLAKSITQSFIYAIKIANMLMTFGSQNEAKAFMSGYKFANPSAKISEVHIDSDAIEVVNE